MILRKTGKLDTTLLGTGTLLCVFPDMLLGGSGMFQVGPVDRELVSWLSFRISRGVPIVIEGGGVPIVMEGSGVPIVVEGSGVPIVMEGSGVPIVTEGVTSFLEKCMFFFRCFLVNDGDFLGACWALFNAFGTVLVA